jgi:hypothetical protein
MNSVQLLRLIVKLRLVSHPEARLKTESVSEKDAAENIRTWIEEVGLIGGWKSYIIRSSIIHALH